MLMHTKGILVMTPDSAMVLTGKHSLDYSGGVSAEDNFGIGGYDRIMGPNGQAQYWAPDLPAAVRAAADRTTSTPTSRPASAGRGRRDTDDPARPRRAVVPARAPGERLHHRRRHLLRRRPTRSGRRPFDIRTVMRAVTDQDHPVLERWAGMADADTAVVFDAHLGGHPVTVLGIESRPIPRRGQLPGRRPRPVDGRHAVPAVVEEDGAGDQRGQRQPAAGRAGQPVRASTARRSRCASCSSSTAPRSAGPSSTSTGRSCSAWSRATTAGRSSCSPASLNDNMEVLAVEGSFASVIGGAPAAAVVFTREVDERTGADPRVRELEAALAAAEGVDQAPAAGRAGDAAGRRAHRRSWARWPPSSRPSTTSSGPAGSARCTTSSPPPSSGRG